MASDEQLGLITLKIERAKKHIVDLNQAIQVFHDSRPYEVATKRDPETRRLLYYMSKAEPIPIDIALIASDALYGIRSALDHLTYQLMLAAGGAPTAECNFPIFNNASQYKTRLNGMEKTLGKNAIKVLSEVEAYKGGKGHELWVLNRLHNSDKHRILLTAGSSYKAFNAAAGVHKGMEEWLTRLRGHPVMLKPFEFMLSTKGEIMCPLKAGDVLLIDLPDAELKEDMKFTIDVAFNEPGVVEGKAVIETIQQLADLVRHTTTLFKPYLI